MGPGPWAVKTGVRPRLLWYGGSRSGAALFGGQLVQVFVDGVAGDVEAPGHKGHGLAVGKGAFLLQQGHDADWNVVETPVAGAKITLNGEDTGLVTDESGSVILETPAEPGVYTVSARYDGAVLVPPVYVFTVHEAE